MPATASESLYGLPVPDRDRWQPLRAGILNVFHYDEQEFIFHDGRLLLRGRNGSGKSVAMEVLLPYLFDADLSPERLSTFGGRDRSIWWKLIGFDETGRDNARGYVWLEFGRLDENGLPEYFTIGAGLQALRANRASTTSWYFTSRGRVGSDFKLTSSSREPLTSSKLAAALGASGTVFTESAADYRELVNKTLFGLPAEQYTALRRMLLELRRPHLSQGLDPAGLSNLLSDSLPPIDAAAVTPLAEGFDGLDKYSSDLSDMRATVAETEALQHAHRLYARKAAAARAGDVATATAAVAAAEAQVTAAAGKDQKAAEAVVTAEETLAANDTKIGELQGTLRGLEDSEQYRAGKDIADAQAAAAKNQRDAEAAARRAAQSATHAETTQARHDTATRTLEDTDTAARAAQDALLSAAVACHLSDTAQDAVDHAQAGNVAQARRAVTDAIAQRRSDLDAVAKLQTASTDWARRAADATRSIETAQDAAHVAADACAAAEESHREARAAYADDAADWLAAQGVAVDDDMDLGDPAVVSAQLNATLAARRAELAARKSELTARSSALRRELTELEKRRAALSKAEVVVPPSSPYRTSKTAGTALYATVDFASNVTDAERTGIEAALQAAGLLDVAVQADSWTPESGAAGLVPSGQTQHVRSAAEVLTVVAGDETVADRTRQLLAALGYVPAGEEFPQSGDVISGDGRYRVGTLVGAWTKPAAEYIGVTARENQRQRTLAEVSDLIEANAAQAGEITAAMSAADAERRKVEEAARAVPADTSIRATSRAVDRTAAVLDERTAAVDAARKAAADAQQRASDVKRELEAALAAATDGPRTQGFPDVSVQQTALAGLDACLRDWLHELVSVERAREAAQTAADDAERAGRVAAEDAEVAAEAAAVAVEAAAQYAALQDALGSSYDEVVTQIVATKAELAQAQGRTKALQDARVSAVAASRDTAAAREAAEAARTVAVEGAEAAGDRLRSGAALGLLTFAGLDSCLPDDVTVDMAWPTTTAAEIAAAVQAVVGGDPVSAESVERAANRVSERRFEVERALADQLALRQHVEDGILLIDAVYRGKQYSLAGLVASLEEDIAATSGLLESTERDLFEQFLAGQVRREVTARIRAADDLIAHVNELMDACPTASSMRLRLVWRLDPDAVGDATNIVELLRSDPADLDADQRAGLEAFFRHRIGEARLTAGDGSWASALLRTLDYRRWYSFTLQRKMGSRSWEDLTRSKHAAMSGGEKAVALHLPLFAAAAGHYASATVACPRLILLDEVFAGVDAQMRGELFGLACDFDLDLVATSESELGTHHQLNGIAVYNLVRAPGQSGMAAIRSVWDGENLHRLLEVPA